ncbi:MAG: IS5 family transposase [Alphaproteobacteria bacterium]|nr:IS5 family transposase [Alphaproteobacteria bacterium]
MRGSTPIQPSMLALVSVESRVPRNHALRSIKPLVDEVLRGLSPTFDEMYSGVGRPSVPPERLLKASLLMALFGIRSERQFCEQLAYNMLFIWFLDMDLSESAFDASTFSKNRERLLEHGVARRFFEGVVELADERRLLSDEHFSTDGTLVEAWASLKSYRRKDEPEGDSQAWADFHGERRSSDTHESKTEPEARLYRKGPGKEARLSYMAHALMENRHGLVVDMELTEANGTAERDAAIDMVDRQRKKRKSQRKSQKSARKQSRKPRRLTLAADKAYDTKDFIRRCRERRVTPHVAQNQNSRRRSCVDARTTRHTGYHVSQKARWRIEKVFGWMKAAAGFRRSRLRGRRRTEAAALLVISAFNLLRITKLAAA